MTDPSQQAEAEQVAANVLDEVRTHFQLIRACDTMLGWNMAWTERLLLRFVRGFYNHRLEMLMGALPERARGTILRQAVKDVYGDEAGRQ